MTTERIKQLQKTMKTAGLQAVALNPSPNLAYLTGLHYHLMERPIVLIVLAEGDLAAILPEFEVGKLAVSGLNIHPFSYGENPAGWVDVFKKACQSIGLNQHKIGVDPNHFRFLEYHYLQQGAPLCQFVAAANEISSLRVHKDSHEAAYMRKAAEIAQAALTASLPFIHSGVTEIELAQELTIQLLRAGSDNDSEFTAIVASGPNSANPHHTPSDRKLQNGDALIIDWGARYKGYYSDLTRNVHLGQPSPEYLQVFDTVLKANAAGRSAGAPGIGAGKVDQVTRAVIDTAGYGKWFTHRTGHGLGMEVHEPVYIFGENDEKLETGMVYTIEPGIYLTDKFGVRIEDDVIVTPHGSESLSDYPRDLIIL
jgi:Xaa-Pro dipeptidase